MAYQRNCRQLMKPDPISADADEEARLNDFNIVFTLDVRTFRFVAYTYKYCSSDWNG